MYLLVTPPPPPPPPPLPPFIANTCVTVSRFRIFASRRDRWDYDGLNSLEYKVTRVINKRVVAWINIAVNATRIVQVTNRKPLTYDVSNENKKKIDVTKNILKVALYLESFFFYFLLLLYEPVGLISSTWLPEFKPVNFNLSAIALKKKIQLVHTLHFWKNIYK